MAKKKTAPEESTAIECSVDLGDEYEVDLDTHSKKVEEDAAVEAAENNGKGAKSSRQPFVQNDTEKSGGLCSRKWCCLCFLFLAVIVAVIVAVYFTIGFGEDVQVPAVPTLTRDPPTAAPTTTLFGELVDIVEPYTDEEVLLDEETPQGQSIRQIYKEVEESGEVPSPHRVKQRYALMTLYRSTSPGGWSTSYGWKDSDLDECDWYGVGTCRRLEDGSYAVTNIELTNNGLSGELPTEICAISEHLEKIDLSDNFLEGQIPHCLKDVKKLEEVYIARNSMGGELPGGLLGISTMRIIDFSENQIGGNVSNLFYNGTIATGLNTVSLHDNLLQGEFPAAVSGFEELAIFKIHGNNVTGEVSNATCELQEASNGTFLVNLTADCDEIICGCCTECF